MAAPALVPASFRAILSETLANEVLEVQRPALDAFANIYAELRDELRSYFISPQIVKELVWPAFRNNEPALDMLMRFSMAFHLKLVESGLAEAFTASIRAGLDAAGRGKGPYMDTDFSEKLVDAARVGEMPGWLTFLVYSFMEPVLVLGLLKAPPARG